MPAEHTLWGQSRHLCLSQGLVPMLVVLFLIPRENLLCYLPSSASNVSLVSTENK